MTDEQKLVPETYYQVQMGCNILYDDRNFDKLIIGVEKEIWEGTNDSSGYSYCIKSL